MKVPKEEVEVRKTTMADPDSSCPYLIFYAYSVVYLHVTSSPRALGGLVPLATRHELPPKVQLELSAALPRHRNVYDLGLGLSAFRLQKWLSSHQVGKFV